ncbi:MAG: DNA repair protein RecN [Lentisphaeria bacterium]|nr:DNA repair protein RecN [Lentisphaeria bacterium]
MLNWLSVQNLAIVEEAEIEFGPSFNVITGETGAGKSVIMGALGLLLGNRADKSAIRTGADHCEISAGFTLAPGALPKLRAFLEENALVSADEPDSILVRRVITHSSSRNFVNGSAVNLNVLRTIASAMVDVHAANENAAILDPANQLDVLDRFAGLQKELNAVRECWDELAAVRREKAAFAASLPSPEEAARLRRDCEEIERADIHAGEDDELTARHDLAANSRSVIELASQVCGGLTDGEDSISQRFAECRRILRGLERIEPTKAEEFLNALDGAKEAVDDLSSELASFASEVEIDEQEFQEMEERMRLLQTLKRRYGPTLDDVLAHLERVRERVAVFDDAELRRKEFEEQEAESYRKYQSAAAQLSEKRKAAAGKLEDALSKETRKLGFLKAAYQLEFSAAKEGPLGIDSVTFLFSANPGVPMIPLRDVASSGEVARVMLAVKTVLATVDEIPILVFDEIDANIGGETACRVGEELALLGRYKQIISISHLAQVAVCADTHFRVAKHVSDGRTLSGIRKLDDAARVKEIARMLGGGESASAHAEDMLKQVKKTGNKK